jgi:hypothetical protein
MQSLLNFQGILNEADGIIISRGMCEAHGAYCFSRILRLQNSQHERCLGADGGLLIPHLAAGNLGLDCEPEKMALVQKTLIQVHTY